MTLRITRVMITRVMTHGNPNYTTHPTELRIHPCHPPFPHRPGAPTNKDVADLSVRLGDPRNNLMVITGGLIFDALGLMCPWVRLVSGLDLAIR